MKEKKGGKKDSGKFQHETATDKKLIREREEKDKGNKRIVEGHKPPPPPDKAGGS